MKKFLFVLVALIGIGISAYAQNNLTTKVTKTEKTSQYTYISFEIKNWSKKTGWIGIKYTYKDKSGKTVTYKKENMAYSITSEGKIEERIGLENYDCCFEITAWFN